MMSLKSHKNGKFLSRGKELMKMNELNRKNSPLKTLSKVAASVAIALAATSTQAVEFETDNFDISFDSTFSLGASWRVEDRDNNLVGRANLYPLQNNGIPIAATYASCTANPNCILPQGAWSNNSDDGNLNYDKGDMFSNVIKGLHEFDMRHKDGDYGLFARALWYYDREIMDGTTRFKDLDGFPAGAWAVGGNTARTEQGYDAEILDFYAWATWDVGEASTLQVRLGEQVVSWGESTFIQHSLNEANAVNLRTLRNPGAELKEALIPSGMLWASIDLTESLSLEGFYQYEWEPVKVDEPGTYFATRDFLGFTGQDVHLGFAQIPEGTPGTVAVREPTRDADDQGQYGLKLAYFTEGGTEFGFYYMNYHNRRPIISAYSADLTGTVRGFLEYPEDIQMGGISFNTATDNGWSIAGEVSYRKDEPLQVDDAELLFATLEPLDGLSAPGPVSRGTSQVANITTFGTEISGYRLLDTVQAQATFTKLLGSLWGSDQTVFLVEVGANQIIDMPSQDELRFEAEGTFRSGNSARINDFNGNGIGDGFWSAAYLPGQTSPCGFTNPADGTRVFTECEGLETNAFADEFSWGYRAAMRWNYDNALWGGNLAPRIVFQHDVSGNTPAPIANFLEGRKALSLGVSWDYQSTWKVDFGYNRFFGNESANLIHDRDYVSLAVSYSI